jgi:hypothetical protein
MKEAMKDFIIPSWKIFHQIQEIILYWNFDFVDPPRYTIQECIERGLNT